MEFKFWLVQGSPCEEGISVDFVRHNKVYEVIEWKVWKKNTEEEEREKELKPIKELSSDKEDQVAKDHKYQSIHKKEKYPKGKSIFLKVIILILTVT